MKRKFLALSLACIMIVAGSLTGCSKANNDTTTSAAETTTAAETTSAPDKVDKPGPDGKLSADKEKALDDLAAGFSDLKLTVLGEAPSSNSRKPTEDRLTPIWKEKTKVTLDMTSIPSGVDLQQWVQSQIIADSLPQIYADSPGMSGDVTVRKMLKDAGMLREFKLDELKKYMPRTAARLASYGMTMEDFYKASCDPEDGKMWTLPSLPSPLLDSEVRNTPYGERSLGKGGYSVWMRDDILKKIYPNVMSAAELKEKVVANGGKISEEEITDIPIKNLDQLKDYLEKVKALGLKADNGNPIIPAHLQYESSRGALQWSLMSATPLQLSWCWPYVINTKDNTHVDFQLTSEWKSYISFMNQSFNEGLFGQEFYTQKPEQRDAKIVNGEYAVVNMWAPIKDNIAAARKKGETYDWRYVQIFPGAPNGDYQDATNQFLESYTGWNTKGINAKKVTEDQIPQILNWFDWQYSQEAAIMRVWGTPDMYTGTGMDRRFKPEYKDVETYMLSAVQAPEKKDGWYYGIKAYYDGTVGNYEVYGITTAYEMNYPLSPDYVYPFTPDSYDQVKVSDIAWASSSMSTLNIIQVLPVDADTIAAQKEYNRLNDEYANIINPYNADLDSFMIKAITGPVDKFEENYKKYTDILNGSDVTTAGEDLYAAWMKYYDLRSKFFKKVN